jgi:hypothetical protein
MNFDVSTLPVPAQRVLDPAGPAPLRAMAAKGVLPGVKPGDLLTVIALLSLQEGDAPTTAKATLANLPGPVLNGALAGAMPPEILDLVAPHYAQNAELAGLFLRHPNLLSTTVVTMAAAASEAVAELIAVNEERLLATPEIIEKLYKNRATRMSTADRIIELAARNNVEVAGIPAFKEIATVLKDELIPEATEEPTYDDVLFQEAERIAAVTDGSEDTHAIDQVTGKEVLKEEFVEQAKKFQDLSPSQRIRRALVGKASDRRLALRDSNPLVRAAAAKSEFLTEQEVLQMTANRNTADDVLLVLARDVEWTRNHQVKYNMVCNPRTPLAYAARWVPYLRDHELKLIQGSKDVPGAIANLARQQLEKKKKK